MGFWSKRTGLSTAGLGDRRVLQTGAGDSGVLRLRTTHSCRGSWSSGLIPGDTAKRVAWVYEGIFLRNASMVAVRIALKVSSFNTAMRLITKLSLAVNSLMGRA